MVIKLLPRVIIRHDFQFRKLMLVVALVDLAHIVTRVEGRQDAHVVIVEEALVLLCRELLVVLMVAGGEKTLVVSREGSLREVDFHGRVNLLKRARMLKIHAR